MQKKICFALKQYSRLVGSRLVLNGLIFSGDIPVNIQLVNFLLVSNIRELSIGTKTKKFW